MTSIFSKKLIATSFALTLSALNFAQAADGVTTTCTGTAGRNSYRVEFENLLPGGRTTLWVNGDQIPRVREYCWQDMGGLRCPHRVENTDFEIYPRFGGSEIEKIFVITNTNGDSNVAELTDCN